MRFIRTTTVRSAAAATVIAIVLFVAHPALAQTAPTKVAIANPVDIFNKIQETKDLRAALEASLSKFQADTLQKQTELKELQQQRDTYKPDSSQYAQANQQLLQKSIEAETWSRLTQTEMQRKQKQQIVDLYYKITETVKDIAQQRGIDLVIADVRPELPTDLGAINPDQLRALLGQRNVLFNSDVVDLSTQVITAMDAKYKAAPK